MAGATEEVKFSLKVLINKEKTKVLSAEVDSDFADVLLSFLTLPLGTIVRLLQKHYGDQAPVFGGLSNLYNSLANLDNVHFWTEAGKLMLLNPRSSFEAECRKLKLNVDDTEPTRYVVCESWDSLYRGCSQMSMNYGTVSCCCGKKINRKTDIKKSEIENDDCGFGVFTINTLSFLISDDLKMMPNIAASFIQTLTKFGITDIDGAEQRTVTIGFNEIMDLLKGSLLSSTTPTLTRLILHRGRTVTPTNYFFEPVLHIKKEETSNSSKFFLKVMVQKSTGKFLFAQAEEDFVDFLFSFLTIPLAGVEWLLSGNTSLGNIDNLYNSSGDLTKYLKTQGARISVFNPQLAPMYLSKNQIFTLSEQIIPEIYHVHTGNKISLSFSRPYSDRKPLDIIDPKGKGSYINGPRMYLLTDDLTVTPLSMPSSVSILNEMKIKLSDVKELEIHIGLEEGLSIRRHHLLLLLLLAMASVRS